MFLFPSLLWYSSHEGRRIACKCLDQNSRHFIRRSRNSSQKWHESLINLVGINLRRQLGKYRDVLAEIDGNESRKPFEKHKATADYVRLLTISLKRDMNENHFHTFDDFITLSILYALKTSKCESANQLFVFPLVDYLSSPVSLSLLFVCLIWGGKNAHQTKVW